MASTPPSTPPSLLTPPATISKIIPTTSSKITPEEADLLYTSFVRCFKHTVAPSPLTTAPKPVLGLRFTPPKCQMEEDSDVDSVTSEDLEREESVFVSASPAMENQMKQGELVRAKEQQCAVLKERRAKEAQGRKIKMEQDHNAWLGHLNKYAQVIKGSYLARAL